ncbi:Addiction module component family protein OS=Myxococcus stipitatus (strain DSM 14675 / JCM 12634 / Mx s8) GN=MYSTI_06622 PE=4 SV=1: Unstab_antitox [Gemmata massiliana]|uniref:Addiction module component, family protein n=1 Tax=Gemmata massiliana TaxID=1210884 RepID=A0A6P2D3Z0_9BACT|nr:Addiction module component family protein OS=Myxococcus stipitatus (strain DSM 14675 / JCM 12634 / Mx s8) GN=MYSTI_06622 PE=4 SV=1: Unstab_antitox [Gemmata massiliana]
MTQTVSAILETLLQLPTEDRGELAARLLESLDAGNDEGAESEWAAEIQTRVEDLRSGKVKTVPWSTAREQILDDTDGGN